MENSLNWSSQIVIGKYIPSTSILHRMDPRAKLTLFILFLAVLSFTHTITLEMVWLVALFLLLYVGKIPVRYFFSGLRPALPLLFLFMLLQLFFLPSQCQHRAPLAPYGFCPPQPQTWGQTARR